MANSIAFAQGETIVTLVAGQSIAVYSGTQAQVFESVGYPNYPVQLDLLGTFTGYDVFGPFAAGATLVLSPGATDMLYSVGTAPVVSGVAYQGAPAAINAAAQITAAQLLGGLITNTHATGASDDLDLTDGADLDAATQLNVDEFVEWSVINLSAGAGDVVTVQVGVATTHTLVGSGLVAISSSALFRTRKTAADTFVTYRIG